MTADKYLIGGAGDAILSTPGLTAVVRGGHTLTTLGCGSGYIGGMSDKSELTFGPDTPLDDNCPCETTKDAGAVTTG